VQMSQAISVTYHLVFLVEFHHPPFKKGFSAQTSVLLYSLKELNLDQSISVFMLLTKITVGIYVRCVLIITKM
jgi:hypothetical protein